jgi:hypothetical protein
MDDGIEYYNILDTWNSTSKLLIYPMPKQETSENLYRTLVILGVHSLLAQPPQNTIDLFT